MARHNPHNKQHSTTVEIIDVVCMYSVRIRWITEHNYLLTFASKSKKKKTPRYLDRSQYRTQWRHQYNIIHLSNTEHFMKRVSRKPFITFLKWRNIRTIRRPSNRSCGARREICQLHLRCHKTCENFVPPSQSTVNATDLILAIVSRR